MNNNPFTLSFGKKPIQFISRIPETDEIINTFQAANPSSQIFMLLGVRGAGKTVLMTTIANTLREDKQWITIELNSMRDMLQSLAAKLYSLSEMHPHFLKTKLDLSAFGFGVSIENSIPVTDIETAISRMLEQVKKVGKRLLITIDEVSNTESMRIFSGSFQIFLRQDYPVFLLMTGLYDNIQSLQNEKNLTFLYRAPKIYLDALNYTAVRNSYMTVFKISQVEAGKMARYVKGYPFAYQVLGYLYWNKAEYQTLEDILPDFDVYLEEYIYAKIWSELSDWDRKIVYEVSAVDEEIKVKDLRTRINMTSELFSVYRARLKRKGLINTSHYGYLSFTLPRFEVFVRTTLAIDISG